MGRRLPGSGCPRGQQSGGKARRYFFFGFWLMRARSSRAIRCPFIIFASSPSLSDIHWRSLGEKRIVPLAISDPR